MHESLFKSVLSSDIDLRRSFLENIVLSGNVVFVVLGDNQVLLNLGFIFFLLLKDQKSFICAKYFGMNPLNSLSQ